MALIRLSKGPREYIIKKERPGQIDKDIEDMEKAIADALLEERNADAEIMKVQLGLTRKYKETLDKYGPTVWLIESLSKADLHRTLVNTSYKLTFKGDELTTGIVASLSLRAYDVCRKSIKGWKNLRDDNGNEVPYKREYIDSLDEGIVQDIANESSGQLGEEESKNSETPPSLSNGSEKTQ